ncbi:hypothetical protein ACM26W_01205 [Halomonas sp. HK25]
MQRQMTDRDIIAGLRRRPLDKVARAAADRLEQLLQEKTTRQH